MKSPGLARAIQVEQRPFAFPSQLLANGLLAPESYECLLENPGDATALGRYAFYGLDPFWVIRGKGRVCEAGPPGALRSLPGDPLEELGQLLERYRQPGVFWREGLPPFLGGAMGYLGYELLHLIEKVPDTRRDDFPVDDLHLVFFGTVLAVDGLTKTTWVIGNGFGADVASAQREADRRLRAALERVDALAKEAGSGGELDERAYWQKQRARVMAARPRLTAELLSSTGVRPVVSREAYLLTVERAREHIFRGDVFELCTSQRFDTQVTASGRELYRVLRGVSPAPFSAYLRFPELELASSSPERFLLLGRDGVAVTRPIKGTRPRGKTAEEDRALIRELQSSEKDRAENVMIVDLARNDLGRVCQFGTVRVPELLAVESYPFTHQLVSTVTGKLRADVTAVDLVRAAFPGGSITGAPKVEAMKLIDRLEPVRRGVFSGSIGYFDFDGAFDLSIVIRTLVKREARVTFHVGGAIVSDSEPGEEYQETLDKAHGLVTALELVGKDPNRSSRA